MRVQSLSSMLRGENSRSGRHRETDFKETLFREQIGPPSGSRQIPRKCESYIARTSSSSVCIQYTEACGQQHIAGYHKTGRPEYLRREVNYGIVNGHGTLIETELVFLPMPTVSPHLYSTFGPKPFDCIWYHVRCSAPPSGSRYSIDFTWTVQKYPASWYKKRRLWRKSTP